MDQAALAGVGNVYRCEVLYRHRVSPFRPGREIRKRTWDAIWTDLVRLMPLGVAFNQILTMDDQVEAPTELVAAGRVPELTSTWTDSARWVGRGPAGVVASVAEVASEAGAVEDAVRDADLEDGSDDDDPAPGWAVRAWRGATTSTGAPASRAGSAGPRCAPRSWPAATCSGAAAASAAADRLGVDERSNGERNRCSRHRCRSPVAPRLRPVAIVFLHGAGGYPEDRLIAGALGAALDEPVHLPRLPDEDMSHAAWSAEIAADLRPDVDTVVGHSFGGSTFLKMLTDGRPRRRAARAAGHARLGTGRVGRRRLRPAPRRRAAAGARLAHRPPPLRR